MKDPQIAITVAEFRSQPVSVFGAVTKPGVIQLRGRKTLYEVLSMAGGPRETAGSSVTVTRRRENGEVPLLGAAIDPTGQFSTAELNVQEILDGKEPGRQYRDQAQRRDLRLRGGLQHDLRGGRRGALAAGSRSAGGRPSPCSWRSRWRADWDARRSLSKARIIRGVPGEPKPREIAVNLRQILNGKAEDIGLRPQDVLVVPTSSRKIFTTYSVPSLVSAAAYAAIYHY